MVFLSRMSRLSMKKLLAILIIFASCERGCFQNFKATYVVGIGKDFFQEKQQKIKDKDTESRHDYSQVIAEDIYYDLLFNAEASYFVKIEGLQNESKSLYNMTAILASHKFIKTSNDEILTQSSNKYLSKYLIRHENDLEWRLSNSEKNISGFLCKKATTTYTITNSKKTSKIEIEAWYAPSIPVSWGPAKFSGLPGLIVQVKSSRGLNYKLLELNEGFDSEIQTPDLKVIDVHKYNKMLENSLKSMGG